MPSIAVATQFLGQAGVRLAYRGAVVLIDPYLSNSVADTFGPELVRMVPAPFLASAVHDADWVLITHEHLDHLDPETLRPLAQASPQCRFVVPEQHRAAVRACGISDARIETAVEEWISLSGDIRLHAVPAAHPTVERDSEGRLVRVGYVLDFSGGRLYHAGDTSPDAHVTSAVAALGPLSISLLPVNERNYYRDRAGILGNMSVREALQFAREINTRAFVPIHWDLFAPNSVLSEEIIAVQRADAPTLPMFIAPEHVELTTVSPAR